MEVAARRKTSDFASRVHPGAPSWVTTGVSDGTVLIGPVAVRAVTTFLRLNLLILLPSFGVCARGRMYGNVDDPDHLARRRRRHQANGRECSGSSWRSRQDRYSPAGCSRPV